MIKKKNWIILYPDTKINLPSLLAAFSFTSNSHILLPVTYVSLC